MKKYLIYIGVVFLFFSSCYKDKGNYNYVELDGVHITASFDNYSVAIDDVLDILPTVDSEIDEADLTYTWEIYTRDLSVGNRYMFYTLAEGKHLKRTVTLDNLIPSPGSYTIRLHVKQKSSDRDFYSSSMTLSVTSPYSGLIVLHGDENESDIGLIKNRVFLVNDGAIQTEIFPDLYSSINEEKIRGKGKSIIQSFTYIMNNIDRATVVAVTDQTGVWAKYADMTKGGDWNSLFNPGINGGKPEMYYTDRECVYAVDNGKIFPRANNTYSIFPIPSAWAAPYDFGSKYHELTGTSRAQGFFFDKSLRGFVLTSQHRNFISLNATATFTQYTTSTPFNLANMGADLLHLERGGSGTNRFMAVMQEDGGTKYLAELNWSAASNSAVAAYKYDMEVLPGIHDAKFYAFGENYAAMCYYATENKIYRYTAFNGESLIGKNNALRMSNGQGINIEGEITMLKILNPLLNDVRNTPFPVIYYNRNRVLLVGSYSNGVGTLHSFTIDQATGEVIQVAQFTGFDRISDANLKPF